MPKRTAETTQRFRTTKERPLGFIGRAFNRNIERPDLRVSAEESAALDRGSNKAIATEQSEVKSLIEAGQKAAIGTDVSSQNVEIMVRRMLGREIGLRKLWDGYVWMFKVFKRLLPEESAISVFEFGIGNATHYAAMSEGPLRALQPKQITAEEKPPQDEITKRAIAANRASGQLPQDVTIDVHRAGEVIPTREAHVAVSSLAIEYDPERNVESGLAHAKEYVGSVDLLHADYAPDKAGLRAIKKGRGTIKVRPTHETNPDGIASHILEAELLEPVGEATIVTIGEGEHTITQIHRQFRFRMKFSKEAQRNGGPIVPIDSEVTPGVLTVITSPTEEGEETRVRLWATRSDAEASEGAKETQKIGEHTLSEMYRFARQLLGEDGKPRFNLDAGGILRQAELVTPVEQHHTRRGGDHAQSVTAMIILDVESGPRKDGYPDASMIGNILGLNADVLDAMAKAKLLRFIGEGKQFKTVGEFMQQYGRYRQEIAEHIFMDTPTPVAAISALNPSAAARLRQVAA